MNKFGQKLKDLRIAASENQADVAAALGVERPRVTLLETGKMRPDRISCRLIRALATHFGVEFCELLYSLEQDIKAGEKEVAA